MEAAAAPVHSDIVSVSGEVTGAGASIYTHKRIEFHLARRKHHTFFRNNGFQVETLNPNSWRKRVASEAGLENRPIGKRVADGSDSGDLWMDPELSFGLTVRKICKIGAGLENLGNTCYLNSVLQCLTYTEPLAAYLQSGKHQSSCRIAGFCALCAIQKHVTRALESSGRSLVPKDLVSNLRCISRNFRSARQEDAHEYMINLLESMHKCCLPSGISYESPAAYEKSLVHKIFGGRLRSQVECQQCFYSSDKFDPFLDISLEIVKADSLPLALKNFTASEILDGGEKHYQCQRCKDKVKAKKRLTIHNAPYVLTIHLKRFHAYDPGRKVDKKVHFGPSLDLKPFSSSSHEEDLKYSLYGVLVHFGHNTHSGHYVCFVRTSSGIWYLLNDNEVRAVSEKTVLDQKAYMLFYVRDRKNIPSQKSVDNPKKEFFVNINGVRQVSQCVLKEQQNCKSFGETKTMGSTMLSKGESRVSSLPESKVSTTSPRLISTTEKNPSAPLSSSSLNNRFSVSTNSIKNNVVSRSECANGKLMTSKEDCSKNSPVDATQGKSSGIGTLSPSVKTDGSLERISSCATATVSVSSNANQSIEESNGSISRRWKQHGLRCFVPKLRLRTFWQLLGAKKTKNFKKRRIYSTAARIDLQWQVVQSMSCNSSQRSEHLTRLRKRAVEDTVNLMNSVTRTKLLHDKSLEAGVSDSDKVVREVRDTQSNQTPIETRKVIPGSLEETKVERWDSAELSSSFRSNSKAVGRKSIGYVPDEWDEDYDRGKRKKVRKNKMKIAGVNPFQAIACRRVKDAPHRKAELV